MARGRELPEIDLRTLPIDPILRQALGANDEHASDAWRVLGAMAESERDEAGIFLLGLMRLHGGDLKRMTLLVDAVSSFRSRAAAEALKEEFYRVPSTPASRTYLNEVLRALTRLPAPLGREACEKLADDERLSVRWRRRFEEALWGLDS
ncbi:MAG: hypothetical protein AB1505_08870 [Candidatus Latescibacterota bacterium]